MPGRKALFSCVSLSIVVLLSPAAHAAAADRAAYLAGNYIVGSPLATLCPADDARTQARALAASLPGAFVMRGLGNSMLPLYRSGTLLVVQPVAFQQLSRGMSVVFQHEGRLITHLLVARTGNGWRTTGLNNRRHDFVRVDEHNLRGVVIAAFTPLEGKLDTQR